MSFPPDASSISGPQETLSTIQEVAEKWNLTPRRVQKMCSDGKIAGVSKFGKVWVIPSDAERPVDERLTTGEYKDWRKKYSRAARSEESEK